MTDDFHFYLLRRADDYVTAIRPTADIDRFGFPAWHGWAISKAWRDGYAAAINEGGQDAATRKDADGASPELVPHPVPPSPDAEAEPQPIGWTDVTTVTGHYVKVKLADGVSLVVGTPLYAAAAIVALRAERDAQRREIRTLRNVAVAEAERAERAEGEARLWLSEYNRLRQEIADATERCVAHLAERDALKAGCDVLRAELRSIGKALQDPQDNLTRTTAECIASLRAERDALRDDLHGLRRSTQERIDRLESEGDNVHKLNMALVAERDALRAELAEDAGGWARAERAEA